MFSTNLIHNYFKRHPSAVDTKQKTFHSIGEFWRTCHYVKLSLYLTKHYAMKAYGGVDV
jgi:hypothetical protein